ncbi:carbohydrate kinase family protein [Peribacillus sp. SCS-37]|uniref:carbohydrate kinase family protein n=1 Tax=Paraperibacillus esterisolvens TaxID=3115296 RepID=UPI003905BC6A
MDKRFSSQEPLITPGQGNSLQVGRKGASGRGGKEGSHIVCIGGAHVDRKAVCKDEVRFETSNPVTTSEMCGGVARNISENLARLGVDVSLISCVGRDKEGDWILENSARHGVNIDSVLRSRDRTGTYTALLNTDGELVISMADMEIYEQLSVTYLMEAWPLIETADFVVIDTNLPEASLFYMIQRCVMEGIPVYADPVSVPKAKRLLPMLNGIHCILPNREEAEILSGMKIESLSDCMKASVLIQESGVKNVVITLGKDGVFGADGESTFHLPAFPVEVLDVTGAGDAFMAGFLYGLSEGEEFRHACRIGSAAAALALQSNLSVHPQFDVPKITAIMKENVK